MSSKRDATQPPPPNRAWVKQRPKGLHERWSVLSPSTLDALLVALAKLDWWQRSGATYPKSAHFNHFRYSKSQLQDGDARAKAVYDAAHEAVRSVSSAELQKCAGYRALASDPANVHVSIDKHEPGWGRSARCDGAHDNDDTAVLVLSVYGGLAEGEAVLLEAPDEAPDEAAKGTRASQTDFGRGKKRPRDACERGQDLVRHRLHLTDPHGCRKWTVKVAHNSGILLAGSARRCWRRESIRDRQQSRTCYSITIERAC